MLDSSGNEGELEKEQMGLERGNRKKGELRRSKRKDNARGKRKKVGTWENRNLKSLIPLARLSERGIIISCSLILKQIKSERSLIFIHPLFHLVLDSLGDG